jgi:hypothetical protein
VVLGSGKGYTAIPMLLLKTIEMPPIRLIRRQTFAIYVNTFVEATPVIDHVHAFIAS